MVWQEHSSIIVMLTQTFECIQVMCAQYWPSKLGKTEKFGEYVVTLVQEDAFAHYKVQFLSNKGLYWIRNTNEISMNNVYKISSTFL